MSLQTNWTQLNILQWVIITSLPPEQASVLDCRNTTPTWWADNRMRNLTKDHKHHKFCFIWVLRGCKRLLTLHHLEEPLLEHGTTLPWLHGTVKAWTAWSEALWRRIAKSKERRRVWTSPHIYPFTCPICRAAVKTACPRLHRASHPAVITPSRCVDGPSVSLPPWRTNRTFFPAVSAQFTGLSTKCAVFYYLHKRLQSTF